MIMFRAIIGPNAGPGHGECFVWQRSSGDVVAVDAGGAAPVGEHAGSLNPSILVLSHDDNDHIRGAVSLIDAASASLDELWIPAEWGILIEQIASTTQDILLPLSPEIGSVGSVEDLIASELTTGNRRDDEDKLLNNRVNLAASNLDAWDVTSAGSEQGFSIQHRPDEWRHWYGASSLDEILKRVRFRAGALIRILSAALAKSIHIRFFSIDLALSSRAPSWTSEGRPGTVTLANAAETFRSLAIRIPAGLLNTYALTQLTVQNRRALCTVLWSNPNSPNDGIVIWSDTDGSWLDHSCPLGFDLVVQTLRASSAPHHASANGAHKRVWAALKKAPKSLVMISAGGQRNQSYHADYRALISKRCCTWCRPRATTYQEVQAYSTVSGQMKLLNKCITRH